MALSIDGQYIGEVGNPSYKDSPNMFEYDSKGDLLVNGQREAALLNKDDLVKIPHDLGHVTIERLLGDAPAQYSGREFQNKISEIYTSTLDKIKKITFLFESFEVEWDDQKTYTCVNRIIQKNPDFSPEDIFDEILKEIEDTYNRRHHNDEEKDNFSKIMTQFKESGILAIKPEISRDNIIKYFFLYCQLKNLDVSNSKIIRNKAFDEFMFLDELMEEYNRKPDIRFSDALLVACSELQHEWDEE
jgi:hypothetical protein